MEDQHDMPTYVYQASDPDQSCDHCRDGFETVQRMRDDPLAACPECEAGIGRVIQPAYFNKTGKPDMSDKRLEGLGFTKIVKDDDGKYKKQFGNDPAADVLPGT